MTDTDTKFEVRDASPEVHTDPAGASEAGTDLQALREVVRFLNGEAPLDGFWFGDHPPGKPYWWRKRLMQAWDTFEAAHREGRLVERDKPVVTDAMVERAARAVRKERLERVRKAHPNIRRQLGEDPDLSDEELAFARAALAGALEDRMIPAPDVPVPTEGEGE